MHAHTHRPTHKHKKPILLPPIFWKEKGQLPTDLVENIFPQVIISHYKQKHGMNILRRNRTEATAGRVVHPSEPTVKSTEMLSLPNSEPTIFIDPMTPRPPLGGDRSEWQTRERRRRHYGRKNDRKTESGDRRRNRKKKESVQQQKREN